MTIKSIKHIITKYYFDTYFEYEQKIIPLEFFWQFFSALNTT